MGGVHFRGITSVWIFRRNIVIYPFTHPIVKVKDGYYMTVENYLY